MRRKEWISGGMGERGFTRDINFFPVERERNRGRERVVSRKKVDGERG